MHMHRVVDNDADASGGYPVLTGLFLNLRLDCVRFCGLVVRARGGPPSMVRTTRATKHISRVRLRESKDIKGPCHSVAGGKTQMFNI